MSKDLRTLCVHPFGKVTASPDVTASQPPQFGAVATPLFVSTSYIHRRQDEVIYPGFFATPNQRRLAEIITKHESGSWGIVFNSGMAAISVSLLALLKAGGHIVLSAPIYGGTSKFVTDDLSRYGIDYSFARSVEEFKKLMRPETKMFFVETPSNPLLTLFPMRELAAIAGERGIITVADNTLASSVNQRPIDQGFDISIQSGTKYLGGHSDLQFGTLVLKDKALSPDILRVANSLGGALSPEACYQAERSIKTLALRVARHNENAMEVARFLSTHALVEKIYYPGLEDHDGHEVARSQMDGYGGVLSFVVSEHVDVEAFLDSLSLITPATSFGGVESIICVPANTSHRLLTPDARQALGISDNLLRLSVGVEAVNDIIDDLARSLGASRKPADSKYSRPQTAQV